MAEANWPHAILPYRCVTGITDTPNGGVRLEVLDRSPLYLSETAGATEKTEIMDVDAVFVATGYQRDLHETLLKDARHLMPGGDLKDARWSVSREYKVLFEDRRVSEDAGVWLQGCNERTHGLSDTLLSVLATRGGEVVRSVFERPGKWNGGDVLGEYEGRQ